MSNPYSPRMPFESAEAPEGSPNTDPDAPADTKAPFLRNPWTARTLSEPGLVVRVPGSRRPKHDTEDSLFAEILKTSRTIRSCVLFYKKPASEEEHVDEVTTLIIVGDGMNGHPSILHGGITASLLDEGMGIYQSVNYERAHLRNVKLGKAEGKLPPHEVTAFTAQLTVKYLRPVATPAAIKVSAKRVKKEGRKEWLVAEVRQCPGNAKGEEVVCATGEALFIEPRPRKL